MGRGVSAPGVPREDRRAAGDSLSAGRLSGWSPLLTAFGIWFAHFMLCWATAEVWPGQWQANASAWAATALALAALGLHTGRMRALGAPGEVTAWTHRLGRGASAIAGVAIGFGAVPSLVFLP
jgi:hypothetical protein